jgi:hypothetical protein
MVVVGVLFAATAVSVGDLGKVVPDEVRDGVVGVDLWTVSLVVSGEERSGKK